MTDETTVDNVHDTAALEMLDSFAAAWTVLSRLLLTSPTQETLDAVRQPDMLAEWPLDPGKDEHTAAGIAALSASTEDADLVKRDFNRLFVGPDKLKAAPWESVHRSEEKLLFEEETLQVRAAYREFGLAAPRLNREPDDHIGLELEFLATLATRALDDPERSGRYQAAIEEFLSDHLLQWVGTFCDLVIANSETEFMTGVGHLLAGSAQQAEEVFCPV